MASFIHEQPDQRSLPILVLVTADGVIRFASQDIRHVVGRSATSLIGVSIAAIFGADALAFVREFVGAGAPDQRFWFSPAEVDGQPALQRVGITAERIWLDGLPAVLLSLSCGRRPRATTNFLHCFEAKAEECADAVFITDWAGHIVYVNKAFERLTGFGADEACGKTAGTICCGLAAQDVYDCLWNQAKNGREHRGIFIHRKKTGELYHEATHVRPFIDAQGQLTHLVFTGTDVSNDIQELEHLKHLSNHDVLTDLPNRALFKDRLDQAIAHANRNGGGFALCFIDIDRFKPINDLQGHAVGDLVLQYIAATLKGCIRDEDTVARIGGDEFGLILKGITRRRYAETIASNILSALKGGVAVPGLDVVPTVSIGICLFPRDGRDEIDLLARADQAMYQAKRLGGDAYHFCRLSGRRGKARNASPERKRASNRPELQHDAC